jgi:hypothetical protein
MDSVQSRWGLIVVYFMAAVGHLGICRDDVVEWESALSVSEGTG